MESALTSALYDLRFFTGTWIAELVIITNPLTSINTCQLNYKNLAQIIHKIMLDNDITTDFAQKTLSDYYISNIRKSSLSTKIDIF